MPEAGRGSIKAVVFTLFLSSFFIFYAWQNIEVVKIRLNQRKQTSELAGLIRDNERLLCEIERHRRMKLLEKNADRGGLKRMTPDDIEIISLGKKANAR